MPSTKCSAQKLENRIISQSQFACPPQKLQKVYLKKNSKLNQSINKYKILHILYFVMQEKRKKKKVNPLKIAKTHRIPKLTKHKRVVIAKWSMCKNIRIPK